MRRPTRAERTAQWTGEFADKLIAAYPYLSGRIDWDAVKHYYFSGKTVTEALVEYALARNLDMETSK
jgi:hypothetical protein